MPSSTSSSDRTIPDVNWRSALICTFLGLLVFIIAYEYFWRSQGYTISLNDDEYYWAYKRSQVKENDLVLIGASRIKFDLDLNSVEEHFKQTPNQLAIVGSNPLPVLENLANDETFKGTLMVGVVPGLFFTPPVAPPYTKSEKWVKASNYLSPTDYCNLFLNKTLENNLVYLQQEDLPLKELIKNLNTPNREGLIIYPKIPPHFATMSWDRKENLKDQVITDKEFGDGIRQGWLKLFTPPPFPGNPSKEEIENMIEGLRQMVLGRVKGAIGKLQSRGAKLIFIRFPSTGPLRELESKITPREKYWDALTEIKGPLYIHFEDHDSLKSFDCPEWSHLSAPDSVLFTKELLKLIKNQ